jgi:hypothetical protein
MWKHLKLSGTNFKKNFHDSLTEQHIHFKSPHLKEDADLDNIFWTGIM